MVKSNKTQLTLNSCTSIILLIVEMEFLLAGYWGNLMELSDYFNGLKEGVTVWSIERHYRICLWNSL